MENALSEPDLKAPEKSPDQLEREMERTRESITEKVEALENQVLGTIHNATTTVSETVDAVKEAVHTAPDAVRDTLHEIVNVFRETIGSFSVSGCISSYPVAALGTTTFAGFLAGYLTGGSREQSFAHGRSTSEPIRRQTAMPAVEQPSMLGEMLGQLGCEARKLASQALSSGVASLRQSIEKHLPEVIDGAVERAVGFAGSSFAASRDGAGSRHRAHDRY